MRKNVLPIVFVVLVAVVIIVYFSFRKYSPKAFVTPNPNSSLASVVNLKTYDYQSPEGGYTFSFNYPNDWIISGYQDQSSRIAIAKNGVQYKNINIGLLETVLPYSKSADSSPMVFNLQTFYLKSGDLSEFFPKLLTGDHTVQPISESVLSVGELKVNKTVSKETFLKEAPTYNISYFIQNKNIGIIVSALIPDSLWSTSQGFQISVEDLVKSFTLKAP